MGNDLTKGSVTKTLLRFTIPFLIANILQSVYGLVDMYIVGKYASPVELSAVSVGSGLMMFINLFILGFGTGGTILVGQMWGAKREKDLRDTIATIFCFIPLVALTAFVLISLVSKQALNLVNCPAESYHSALYYFQTCLVGLLFMGVYTCIASSLRGMGDSKGPTIFVGISCILNIIGDIILVGFVGMGAFGAALATAVAQGCSVIVGFIYLKHHSFPFDFKPASFRIHKARLKDLLRIGIPTAFQETMTNVSFLVLEAVINTFGYTASAAAGICDRLFGIAIIPSLAFSSAVSAMVAQNTGAGEYQRGRKSLAVGLSIGVAIAAVIFCVFLFFPAQVIRMFNKDPELLANGVAYMTYYKYDMLICTFAFCINGYINGTGHTRYTMLNNLLSSFFVRLPLIWFIGNRVGATLMDVGFGLPVASVVQVAIGVAFLLFAKSEREQRKALKK